jgi:hypothetical protein
VLLALPVQLVQLVLQVLQALPVQPFLMELLTQQLKALMVISTSIPLQIRYSGQKLQVYGLPVKTLLAQRVLQVLQALLVLLVLQVQLDPWEQQDQLAR